MRVTPRASKNEIVEILADGTIKIRLTAPPVEGKANKALLKFISKVLDVPVSNMELVAGASGRDKRILISSMNKNIIYKRIVEHLRGSTSSAPS